MKTTYMLKHLSLLFSLVVALGSNIAAAAEPLLEHYEPKEVDYFRFLIGDFTVALGAKSLFEPVFSGAKKNKPTFFPIMSFNKKGTEETFSSPHDSLGAAIIETRFFRIGPILGFQSARDPSDDKALIGLKKIGLALEPGFFAEIFPTQTARLRVELRQGIAGHFGQVIDFSADAYALFDNKWLVALGPRLSLASARALKPYFDIDQSQSFNTGLPLYTSKSGIKSVGFGSVIKYSWTQKVETKIYGEYERLVGSTEKSPLVSILGSKNQFTAGIGISYKLDFTSPFGK